LRFQSIRTAIASRCASSVVANSRNRDHLAAAKRYSGRTTKTDAQLSDDGKGNGCIPRCSNTQTGVPTSRPATRDARVTKLPKENSHQSPLAKARPETKSHKLVIGDKFIKDMGNEPLNELNETSLPDLNQIVPSLHRKKSNAHKVFNLAISPSSVGSGPENPLLFKFLQNDE